MATEINRLQDVIRCKDKALDQLNKDNTTLKSQVASNQRALQAKQQECDVWKDKCLKSEGTTASLTKELAAMKSEKRKLESAVDDLRRQGEKLQERLRAAGEKTQATPQLVASVQSELRTAQAENDKLAEDCKGLDSLLRARDRAMAALQKKADESDALYKANGELENRLLEAQKLLDAARAETRTQAQVLRLRELDIGRSSGELDKARAELTATQEQLSRLGATLKAAEARNAELQLELGVVRDELVRSSAVAARVAVSEVKAGSKAEGTVPLAQHQEQIRYMGGEISRLKDRIEALTHELQERFKKAAQQGYMSPMARASTAGIKPEASPQLGYASPLRASFAGTKVEASPLRTQASDTCPDYDAGCGEAEQVQATD